MGIYLYFRVLNFTVLASITQRMSIQSACIQQWFRFKLFSNFDFYLCLHINFHTSLFRVFIFAASGPYWVLISQKKWVLIWSLSQSLEVPNNFRDSAMEEMQRFYRLLTHIMNVSWIETLAAFFS